MLWSAPVQTDINYAQNFSGIRQCSHHVSDVHVKHIHWQLRVCLHRVLAMCIGCGFGVKNASNNALITPVKMPVFITVKKIKIGMSV